MTQEDIYIATYAYDAAYSIANALDMIIRRNGREAINVDSIYKTLINNILFDGATG